MMNICYPVIFFLGFPISLLLSKPRKGFQGKKKEEKRHPQDVLESELMQ